MSNTTFQRELDQLRTEWDELGLEDRAIATLGFEDIEENGELQGYELAEEAEQLRAEWAAMSAKRRAKAWDRFTQDIDEGTPGWNRFYPILWPAYETGASVL